MFDRFRFQSKRSLDDASATSGEEQQLQRQQQQTTVESAKRVKTEEPQAEPEAAAASVGGGDDDANRSLWQERWHAICSPCFQARCECIHFPVRRLRLLIVGHNPSDHAWKSGYSYSNPSNHMWNLLRGRLTPLSWRGVLPHDAHVTEQNTMPHSYGVGMTSIGLEPGNDAAAYDRVTMTRWKQDFFRRLRRHVRLVCQNEHETLAGISSESASRDDFVLCRRPHSPMIIAFSGKRQFSWLFTPPLAKIDNYGKQTRLPPDWPRECLHDCEVWVLPSTSGRAAMTKEQRSLPYQWLADAVHAAPWPTDQRIIKIEASTLKEEEQERAISFCSSDSELKPLAST
ncbi:hypothetical protein PINS_up001367 [Pythium insidiosum]|nr:hypothetical protein PINS_up001367 [Pythium insidiosum]